MGWQDELYKRHTEKSLSAQGRGKVVLAHEGHEYDSKTEILYAQHLEGLKMAGVAIRYWPHPCKLRLAKNTTYEPDFLVYHYQTGRLEFHEVKGFWRDDARVKIKVAAEIHKWASFVAVSKQSKKNGGGWEYESF